MKYIMIYCTDTNFALHDKYLSLQAAKITFHQYSAIQNESATEGDKK